MSLITMVMRCYHSQAPNSGLPILINLPFRHHHFGEVARFRVSGLFGCHKATSAEAEKYTREECIDSAVT